MLGEPLHLVSLVILVLTEGEVVSLARQMSVFRGPPHFYSRRAGPGIGPAPGSQVGGRLREEGPLPADGGERMAQTKVQIGRL